MTSREGTTRRAACAAFLPFAAVLLLVAPAEASVPRGAGVTQVDAVALASLERPALGLASPTLEPSRFSLGEDLSVFDATNAQWSLGLCGLEASRCSLTYARNNPLKYVDPDGRASDLAYGPFSDNIPKALPAGTPWSQQTPQQQLVGGVLTGITAVAAIGPLVAGGPFLLPAVQSYAAATGFGGTVLLGESMSRVGPAAEKMNAMTFNTGWTNFVDVMGKNIQWLRTQVSRGAQVFDIGLDPRRPDRGVFYRAETKFLEKSGYVREHVGEILVKGEKVKLYRWAQPREKALEK